MTFRTKIAMAVLIGCALGASGAAAQTAPCQNCQQPGCGCQGHPADCCCQGACEKVPEHLFEPNRPSPPPSCADGVCYPNYQTWGHYGTRWRRWPIEIAPPVRPGVAVPRPLGPDVPAYVPPPMEEEDRRAPPPSEPRVPAGGVAPRIPPQEEGVEQPESDESPAPSTGEGTPPAPSDIFGPTAIPPGDSLPFSAPPEDSPGVTPLTPPTGSETEPGTSEFDEPMGDIDLPPTPPFRSTMIDARERSRQVPPTPEPAVHQQQRAVHHAPQEDPPPTMPSLASVSHR